MTLSLNHITFLYLPSIETAFGDFNDVVVVKRGVSDVDPVVCVESAFSLFPFA
jgi:hypothetical protein